ncbi:MAG: acetyltransferase [Ruminococcus callidus]|nr:acetyltransferase [Ruminococcus callidus]
MKQLLIIGASGHGKVVADIAELNGYDSILFFDDNDSLKKCGKYPVVGKSLDISRYDGDVIVAIGNARIREQLLEKFSDRNVPILIHPNATIASTVKIGMGTVVMAGAVINADAVIGKGVIINTCSSVDHDCIIDNYSHISVGAHVAGTVHISDRTWIGAGATISNNINICSDCMIGAGAVVIKNINESGTYVGVPVRKIK